MTFNNLAFIVAVQIIFVMNVFAQNWPHWRGPNKNGIVESTNLPLKWSKTKSVVWRVKLPGPGPSTPIIWGHRIYLTAADENELVLICIDKSGKQIWEKALSKGDRVYYGGESNNTAPSPTTDGKHVWAFFGTGDFVCVDMDGNEVWRTNIQDRYGKFSLNHGMVVSPLLDGNVLYLSLMHDNQQAVIALDKNSGKEIWKSDRATNARSEALHSYTSPVIYQFSEPRFLLVHGSDSITAHNLNDGKELWRYGGLQDPNSYQEMFRFVANPFPAEDFILVPTAKNGAIIGLDPRGASGNITGNKKHVIWRRDKNTTDVPSPIVYDGLAYLCRENGRVLCLDITNGEEVYYKKVDSQRYRGSPVLTDGKLYLMGMDGTITVIKTGRKFDILARNQINNEPTAASIVISDGTIYQRTFESLYAISN